MVLYVYERKEERKEGRKVGGWVDRQTATNTQTTQHRELAVGTNGMDETRNLAMTQDRLHPDRK